jgi:ubiquinone/menaquinone biosynthesis C-methylase UbiE
MAYQRYLMESEEESLRLDLKTDSKIVETQALWAGIKPGMRVADIACGPGKTSFYLNKLVQPNGKTVGVDIAEKRIRYAKTHYHHEGLEFHVKDICEPLDKLGTFDFIWIRFVLEYYRLEGFDILKNIYRVLKPGGILCVIDLDYNCLIQFGIPSKLEGAIQGIMRTLEKNANFDPYVGKKLYTYLYDLGCLNIDVRLDAHNLIFGESKETDIFNWTMKIKIAGKNSGYQFSEYEGGYEEFFEEFRHFFNDPRRFTYTPLVSCRGYKPKT